MFQIFHQLFRDRAVDPNPQADSSAWNPPNMPDPLNLARYTTAGGMVYTPEQIDEAQATYKASPKWQTDPAGMAQIQAELDQSVAAYNALADYMKANPYPGPNNP